MIRAWDLFRHGKYSVEFISSFQGEHNYRVYAPGKPEGVRVRYFVNGAGTNNDYNKHITAECLEAVNAFITELNGGIANA